MESAHVPAIASFKTHKKQHAECSERNISFYMSQNLKIRESEVEIGLATGYRDANVIPLVRWKKNNWFIAPMYGNTWYYTKYPEHTVWVKGKKDAGVIIGYEFKIGKRK